MASSEDEVIDIADLVHLLLPLLDLSYVLTSIPDSEGIHGACADDMKGIKCAIIDWITPKGQSLTPHIPWNGKAGRGFNHKHTGALLCPAGLDWNNWECVSYLI